MTHHPPPPKKKKKNASRSSGVTSPYLILGKGKNIIQSSTMKSAGENWYLSSQGSEGFFGEAMKNSKTYLNNSLPQSPQILKSFIIFI